MSESMDYSKKILYNIWGVSAIGRIQPFFCDTLYEYSNEKSGKQEVISETRRWIRNTLKN